MLLLDGGAGVPIIAPSFGAYTCTSAAAASRPVSDAARSAGGFILLAFDGDRGGMHENVRKRPRKQANICVRRKSDAGRIGVAPWVDTPGCRERRWPRHGSLDEEIRRGLRFISKHLQPTHAFGEPHTGLDWDRRDTRADSLIIPPEIMQKGVGSEMCRAVVPPD
jgi:hypothetical protein